MATTNTAKKPMSSGLGLEGLSDLSSLLNAPLATNRPQELPLDMIDEDPNQPRHADNPGFTTESLKELAATIQDRGVKSPISVRVHPDIEGRYIINHGARRYRASRIAGKDSIPAFIDNDYSEADQVIENLQRNELTAREIADFVGRELAKGKIKSEIAREIGKSPAFVTQHVTLLDLPEPIAKVFNKGRANDVTVVNELVTAYKKNPDEVVAWMSDENQELTRGSVKLLREYLADKRKYTKDQDENDSITIDAVNSYTDDDSDQTNVNDHHEPNKKETDQVDEKKVSKESGLDKLKKAIIQVKHDDRPARLILNRRPPAEGWAWLKYDDDGHEFEADLSNVQLVALLEG